jgi:hypothetical protein
MYHTVASVRDEYGSHLQGPSTARQRVTGDGGDPGTPSTRQLVDEAADMLSTLLASPDKVRSPAHCAITLVRG